MKHSTVLRMMHTNMSSKCHRPFYHIFLYLYAAAIVREFDIQTHEVVTHACLTDTILRPIRRLRFFFLFILNANKKQFQQNHIRFLY